MFEFTIKVEQKMENIVKEKPLNCDEKSLSEKELKKKNVAECFICKRTFSNKGNLKIHIAAVHEGKKPFKCSICDFKFSVKRNLTRHMASVHEIN